MKSGVTICEMTMIDYDSVRDLIASTEGLTLRSADSREATDLYPKRNPGLSFAARSGGRLIGCVMWGHDGGRGYLQHLAVAPEARRQEIAAALVERRIATLAKLGIEKTHVDVLTGNILARRYWVKSGWQERHDTVRFSFVSSSDPNA